VPRATWFPCGIEYDARMSYQTVEVELENGQVRPSGAETLPAKAHASLTIIATAPAATARANRTLGAALRELDIRGRGDFTDLSSNPRHLDDFGK